MQSFIPAAPGWCSGNCETGIWAGIGGFAFPNFPNGSSLPQHGFAVWDSTTDFMWEWAVPGAAANESSLGSHFVPGDNVTVQGTGVSSNSCSGSPSSAAQWFCFQWFDTTSNWTAEITLQNASTSSTPWYPNTFEFIAEVSSGGHTNAPYGSTFEGEDFYWITMSGWGVDDNGTAHHDDGFSLADASRGTRQVPSLLRGAGAAPIPGDTLKLPTARPF
jgi:hypothetical protein